MMRCIENAVAGGAISREEGTALQERVTELLRKGLASHEAREAMTKELEAKALNRRRRAMLMEVRRKVLTEQLLTHRNAKGENDPAEALWLLVENFGQGKFEDIEFRRLTILGRTHARLEGLLHEFRKGWLSGDLRRQQMQIGGATIGGNKEVLLRMSNLADEIFGKNTGDETAAALAKAWIATVEDLRQRFNRAGGAIGKLEYGYLPQSHDAEALMRIGQRAWVDYLMQPGVLDRKRMVDWETQRVLDDDELRERLMQSWIDITTDGWIARDASYQPFGKGALAKQKDDHHRFIHFTDGATWMRYMRDFKAGDPFEAMMQHISVMARDIATLEIMGPNPEGMRNYLKQLVMQHAAQVKPVQRMIRDEMDRMGRILQHTLPGDVGERYVARVTAAMKDLSDFELKLKAKGGEDDGLKAAAKAAAARIDELEKELEFLEPAHIGEKRARTEGEIKRLDEKIAARQAEIDRLKAGDGGKRQERRARGAIAEAQRSIDGMTRERETLQQRLDELEQADNSILTEEPEVYQDIIDTLDKVRGEIRRIRVDGFRAVGDPMETARRAISRHDAMWDILRGTHYAPVSSFWANTLQAGRNWITAAVMGSAFWTSMGDITTQRIARRLAGMPYSYYAVIKDTLGMIGQGDRRDAVASGLILDSAMHTLHQNAVMRQEGVGRVTMTQFLADRVLQFSLLTPWTEMGKKAFGMAFMREIGAQAGKHFDELPPLMKRLMSENGITSADWNLIRKTKQHEPEPGVGFLRPNEIAQGPAGEALAEKYLAMILRHSRMAVVEGTTRSRTFLGSAKPGTVTGELARNIGQFKSFAVAFTLLHVGRIAREFQAGNTKFALGLTTQLIVSHAIMGALVLEIGELMSGRKPKLAMLMAEGKPPGADYWGAGLLKAGGLGVFGDFLFAPVNYFGGGLAATFMGPLGGAVERFRQSTFGEVQDWMTGENKEGRAARIAIEQANRLTPGSSLWQIRLLKERLVINELQRAFDPNHEKVWRKHEQLVKKVRGTEYWWRPGDRAPDESPLAVTAPVPKVKGKGKTPLQPADYSKDKRITQTSSTRFNVLDGDTLEVGGKRWRIEGYDAPEVFSSSKTTERLAGVKAALRLQDLMRDAKKVELQVSATPDGWGRGRARLWIDGRDVADIMASEGHSKRQRVK